MPIDPLTLKLPEGYSFADLKLRRDAEAIDLDMNIVRVVCKLNGLNFERVCANPGPVISTLLSVWYKSHLAQGGAPDAVMELFRQEGQLH
jgi:hypothetical protein